MGLPRRGCLASSIDMCMGGLFGGGENLRKDVVHEENLLLCCLKPGRAGQQALELSLCSTLYAGFAERTSDILLWRR